MSSQRGNVSRSRAQKHQNSTKFSNTRHDTSQRTKQIVSMTLDGLCARCKEKLEWKIKYKKYKPLTQPATCTKCHQKTVKKAYYIVCEPCATSAGICAKCAEKKEVTTPYQGDERKQAAEQSQLEQELQMLSERQRRSFFRLQEQGKLQNIGTDRSENHSETASGLMAVSSLGSDNEEEEDDTDGDDGVNSQNSDDVDQSDQDAV